MIFLGLCCHPVDIYLYWLLLAASSHSRTMWIREEPFRSSSPTFLPDSCSLP